LVQGGVRVEVLATHLREIGIIIGYSIPIRIPTGAHRDIEVALLALGRTVFVEDHGAPVIGHIVNGWHARNIDLGSLDCAIG